MCLLFLLRQQLLVYLRLLNKLQAPKHTIPKAQVHQPWGNPLHTSHQPLCRPLVYRLQVLLQSLLLTVVIHDSTSQSIQTLALLAPR